MFCMRLGLFFLASSFPVLASDSEHMEVTGLRYSWLDTVQTASEGQVDHEQLQQRPILRPGEIMESVPGLITTQHSGTGKANQYFLRGFNLDHGTDFATFVDGIPINMPSHAHGQGYTDVNFLVPEILERVEYSKGPYAAEVGDFSGAGHVQLQTRDEFPHGLLKYTSGSYDYHRLLLLDTVPFGQHSRFSYALEGTRYQGPWSGVDERLRKSLAWLKWSIPTDHGQHTLTFQHYKGSWNAADQIPERAVEAKLLNRLGTVDKSTGGRTQRDSFSWMWTRKEQDHAFHVQLYAVNYGLNLWSNLSYFLEDPELGDQFEQEDRRSIAGSSLSFSQDWVMGSIPGTLILGLQSRYDDIRELGFYKTVARERLEAKGKDAVRELQNGAFFEQEWKWTPDFQSTFGLRYDQLDVRRKDRLAAGSYTSNDAITSPKFSTRYRVLDGLWMFASAGQSFHSNDARGITSRDSAAPGLVPVRGYEVGSSWTRESFRMSVALWRLQLESELLYIGDAGVTEPARASRRQGVDTLVQLSPSPGFHADLELSWANARFLSDPDAEGRRVEGHLPFVGMLGLGSQLNSAWSVDARFRHFGKRPLTADGQQSSEPTTVVNGQLAYAQDMWEASLDLLNALDTDAHDIDYFYESQLADESEPVADRHYHPVEPRSVRVQLGRRF
ncbi:MAG TPA: TonB-dependent receptor [Oligoflexus sp.]|uniref:TonB-dependent receptor n=1 Tax=Oligoflexus sp. TaxID=1971216 RepID=UPI002D7EBDDB|nr:TonB-dependent receptor [Oligoflexus sp.]HET9237741.1 TonB-dependent receptor [Oligoflexus sp.]